MISRNKGSVYRRLGLRESEPDGQQEKQVRLGLDQKKNLCKEYLVGVSYLIGYCQKSLLMRGFLIFECSNID